MSGEIHLFKLTISLPHVGNREDGFDLSRNELRRRDACLITDSRQGGRTDLDVEEDEIQVWSVSGATHLGDSETKSCFSKSF